MTVDFQWFFGLFFSALLIVMGAVIGHLYRRLADLGGRIDTVAATIDKVKDDYVRRSESDDKMGKIDKSVDEVKANVKEISAMLIKVLIALGKQVT